MIATQPVTSFIKVKPIEQKLIKKVRYTFSDSDDDLKPIESKPMPKADSDLKALLLRIQPKGALRSDNSSSQVQKSSAGVGEKLTKVSLKIKPLHSKPVEAAKPKFEDICLSETIEITTDH